jgi:UDP:flavonoid glycosyltransferase YjiC (YdhE family)
MNLEHIKLDLVAPPFAGHLFPLLELGIFLKARGVKHLRILSTEAAREPTHLSGLEHVTLLPGKDKDIEAIANPPYRVKNNPRRLMGQLGANLALTKLMKGELEELWSKDKPDVVLADFTLPMAGLLAKNLGIHWWTSLPTPCALETRHGTPSYLGGWSDSGLLAPLRNAIGHKMIRGFKNFVAWYYQKQLGDLGIASLYRENGDEIVYSPEKIFALGMKEFELERDWPPSLEFVGSLTASPPYSHIPPTFAKDKAHILISLGTHLPWAKENAVQFIQQLANQRPELAFHFSFGKAGGQAVKRYNNVSLYDYIPYDLYLHHYKAAIIHGGTGVTYSCIKAGAPMLVWPHDYDQFDHAVRIVHHQLGLRFSEDVNTSAAKLQQLLGDKLIQDSVVHFKRKALEYNPGERVLEQLYSLSRTESK